MSWSSSVPPYCSGATISGGFRRHWILNYGGSQPSIAQWAESSVGLPKSRFNEVTSQVRIATYLNFAKRKHTKNTSINTPGISSIPVNSDSSADAKPQYHDHRTSYFSVAAAHKIMN